MSSFPPSARPFPLFSIGFRPFFLAAGLYAAWSAVAWICFYVRGAEPPHIWDDMAAWHGHEMLFGFVAAVVAGFLLTAVPNWTKARPIRAWPLAVMVGVWFAGRLAMHGYFPGSATVAAAIDVLFLPMLGLSLLPAIIRGHSTRNVVFFILIALLTAMNTIIHAGMAGIDLPLDPQQALTSSIFIVIQMIAVFAGRIIPLFTRNALKVAGIGFIARSWPALDALSLGSVAILVLCALAGQADTQLAGAVALAAGVLNIIRMAPWNGHQAFRMPIVLVLHAGYVWIALGLTAYGYALLLAPSLQWPALHVLTIGGIGTMTLAMMSRVALGHTGRTILASKPMVAVYALLQLAVLVRIAGGLGWIDYTVSVAGAGWSWSAAFAIFSVIHLPILTRPRADGRHD